MSLLLFGRRFPPEFRIPASTGDWSQLVSVLSSESPVLSAAGVAPDVSPPVGATGLDDAALANLCTGLWRARRRMVDPATGGAREDMRVPFRHLESVWDTLAKADVEIQDHTDELVPEYGAFALEVLAYQPTPGLSRDQVVDTIKPSVYVGGRLVQMGQVIVGTPEDTPDGAGGRTTS